MSSSPPSPFARTGLIRVAAILGGLTSIAIGLACFVFPSVAGAVSVYFLSGLLLLAGAGYLLSIILKGDIARELPAAMISIVAIACAIFFLRNDTVAADVLVYSLCAFLALYGVTEIWQAVRGGSLISFQSLVGLINIILAAAGIVLLRDVDPLRSMAYLIGAAYLLHGVLMIIASRRVRRMGVVLGQARD